MEKQNKELIPFTGFPMQHPEMLIGRPEPNPCQQQTAAAETDFSRDTQTWD